MPCASFPLQPLTQKCRNILNTAFEFNKSQLKLLVKKRKRFLQVSGRRANTSTGVNYVRHNYNSISHTCLWPYFCPKDQNKTLLQWFPALTFFFFNITYTARKSTKEHMLTVYCVLNITEAQHAFRIFIEKLPFLSHWLTTRPFWLLSSCFWIKSAICKPLTENLCPCHTLPNHEHPLKTCPRALIYAAKGRCRNTRAHTHTLMQA